MYLYLKQRKEYKNTIHVDEKEPHHDIAKRRESSTSPCEKKSTSMTMIAQSTKLEIELQGVKGKDGRASHKEYNTPSAPSIFMFNTKPEFATLEKHREKRKKNRMQTVQNLP